MAARNQGNGERKRPGHSDRHHFGHLENRCEKREREAREAQRTIADLTYRIQVAAQAARSAIALLAPYSAKPEPRNNRPLKSWTRNK
jgi:hypothetical protein